MNGYFLRKTMFDNIKVNNIPVLFLSFKLRNEMVFDNLQGFERWVGQEGKQNAGHDIVFTWSNDHFVEIPFYILDPAKQLIKESKVFQTEEALHDWLDEQKVDDKPLWKYLLQNHSQELNNTYKGIVNEKFQQFRESVKLQAIYRHCFEILDEKDKFGNDIVETAAKSLSIPLIEAYHEKSNEKFDKLFEHLDIKTNGKIFQKVIQDFCYLNPNHKEFGNDVFEMLEKSNLPQKKREEIVGLLKDAILDNGLELVKSRKHNSQDMQLLSEYWGNVQRKSEQLSDILKAQDTPTLPHLKHPKLLARALRNGKYTPEAVMIEALKKSDFQEALVLYTAAQEMQKPQTIKRKIYSWVNKVVHKKEYKAAKMFVQKYRESKLGQSQLPRSL